MSKVAHSPQWSSSTNTKGLLEKDQRCESPLGNDKPKQRRTILQRLTGFNNSKIEEGSRICESVVNISLTNNTDVNGDPSLTEEKESSQAKSNILSGNMKSNEGQSDINSVVTVYHHKTSCCYEVVTYDINKKTELNRLYIPVKEVSDLTNKRKSRLSFIGKEKGKEEEKKFSMKIGELMTCSLDEDQVPRLDIFRSDTQNPSKRKSISSSKPSSLTPVAVVHPVVTKNGKLTPKDKRVTILQRIGNKLPFFRNRKSILSVGNATTPFDRISERNSYGSQEGERTFSDVPQQQSSTSLTHNLKYDKGVDQMLSEAAQMRADLAARRAAEGEGNSKRFGRKQKK